MNMKRIRLHVNHVVLVDIVRAAGYQRRANNAPLVLVKMIRDKRRASNAAPVNLAIPPVMPHANYALPTPIMVAKEETPRALIAQRVGPRWPGVPRAPRAVPAPTAMDVKIVMWVNTVQTA